MPTRESARIRIEDLVTLPRPSELAVSPDGRRIAFFSRIEPAGRVETADDGGRRFQFQ